MVRSSRHVTLCALLLTACSSSTPRLHQPNRIDAFCGDRVAIPTAIESIVSSTGDASNFGAVPTSAEISKIIKDSGGIIAHWSDQPLYQPSLAKVLGGTGDYVTLGDAAIGQATPNKETRLIFLTVKTAGGAKTFALSAYDVQDVCNEGKKSA